MLLRGVSLGPSCLASDTNKNGQVLRTIASKAIVNSNATDQAGGCAGWPVNLLLTFDISVSHGLATM